MEWDLINVFQNIALENWHIPAYHPAGKSSPYLLLKMKLLELVIHSWDIFSSLNPSYKIQNEEAKILCEVWKEPDISTWLYTPDLEQIDPTTIDFYKEKKNLKSYFIAPVIYKNLEGVLFIDSKKSHAFPVKQQKILSGLANQMAWHLNQERMSPLTQNLR
jgi:hypothetical protein